MISLLETVAGWSVMAPVGCRLHFIGLMMLQSAEQFLRAIAPDDLHGCGCYVIAQDEIAQAYPELRRDFVLAYTSDHLATALQPWLESQGRWVGDGFSCIVMRNEIQSWREVLGIATHELAHWLTSEPVHHQDTAESLAVVAEYAISDNTTSPWPPWTNHGRDFCRAAAHLSARAGELVASVRPSLVRFSMQYSHVPESTWLEILAGELQYSGPIREILRQPPPQRFTELWNTIEGVSNE